MIVDETMQHKRPNEVEVVYFDIIFELLTMCAKSLIFIFCFLHTSKHFDTECAVELNGLPKISKQPMKMSNKKCVNYMQIDFKS